MIYGIDLGTTNSCVSYYVNNELKILQIDNEDLLPSVVKYNSDNSVSVGYSVLNHPESIYEAKRLVGKDLDISKNLYSYKLNQQDGIIEIFPKDKPEGVYPKEVLSEILKKIKNTIDDDNEIRVVITVPAYFNNYQREDVYWAAEHIGMKIERMINEPTAASLAYGLGITGEQTVLVFDLGGGTLDCSILRIDDDITEVIGTYGNTRLGGKDFTERIEEYLSDELEVPRTIGLREICEKVKKGLSKKQEVGFIFNEYEIEINRDDFKLLCSKEIEECSKVIQKTLELSKIRKEDIDEIILVGGATRMKCIIEMIEENFNTRINNNLDPDKTVCLGAGVQAGIIMRKIDKVLCDITPMNIGIGVGNGLVVPLIEYGMLIPVSKTKSFMTHKDNQNEICIDVYQGIGKLVEDNILLTRIKKKIPIKRRGEVKIDISLTINYDGILKVSVNNETDYIIRNINTDEEMKESNIEIIEIRKQELVNHNELSVLRKRLEEDISETERQEIYEELKKKIE